MDAYAKPLRALAEQVAWFVRKKSLRLLHVTADQTSREAAVELVMGLEYHADNRAPFVRTDTPFSAAAPGWEERSAALRAQHEKRRAGMEKGGYALPALRAAPATGKPLVDFAVQVQQVLLARCAPLEGLVVVLAPVAVEGGDAWDAAVGELVATPSLAEVRWVIVDLESVGIPRTLRALGGDALLCTCRVDEQEARRDLAQRLEAATVAGPSAPGLAQVGAAWPRGVQPPSHRRLPPMTPEQQASLAASLGIPAGLVGPDVRQIRPLVLRAAQRLRLGDPAGAVRYQGEAAACAARAGLTKEATLLELMLCTYLVHANQRELAAERYEACARRARESHWHDLEAQALMARGGLHLVSSERERAAVCYTRAGAAARDGGQIPLAIEGFRMAGQLRADAGDREQATQLFTEAIELAGPLPPAEAGRTSAPLAARQLAQVCRKRGLKPQATSLEEQASRLEQAARG